MDAWLLMANIEVTGLPLAAGPSDKGPVLTDMLGSDFVIKPFLRDELYGWL